MGKFVTRLLAILIVVVIMSGTVSFQAVAADRTVDLGVSPVSVIQTEINSLAVSGGTVTVTGSMLNVVATLRLDIPANVSVKWEAVFRGTANPVIDYYGNGTFEVAPGAWIQNTSSANSYTSIRAKGVEMIVSGGIVQGGKGRAIEGAGPNTVITVKGGSVFNEATNNLFPAIDMTDQTNTALNVVIEGGIVSAEAIGESAYGYVMQTYGNVLVKGGKLSTSSGYGRCINLVGNTSNATVTGGVAVATGTAGTAISTSTTNPSQVVYSSVTVTGGFVASFATGNGWAIHTTGSQSTVVVAGGCVFAFGNSITNGNASVTAASANSVVFTQWRSAGGFAGATAAGAVIAWDRQSWGSDPHDRAPYNEGATRHISTSLGSNVNTPPSYAQWTKEPVGEQYDGIIYDFGGSNRGFIPLAEVKVSALRTIRSIADSGGYIFPEGIQTVGFGDTPTFLFEPAPGRIVTGVDIINATTGTRTTVMPTGDTYTLPPVRHDVIVVVHFTALPPGRFTVVSYAGSNGTITPSGLESFSPNTTGVTRTITPTGGYLISDVRVNGESALADDPNFTLLPNGTGIYRFPAIQRNSVITATFEQIRHSISANAIGSGSISPSDVIAVEDGGNRSFTLTPDPGFYIEKIEVDGSEVPGARSLYEFTDVKGNHTITVTFAQNVYLEHIITATAGSGGVVSPQGEVVVPEGDSKTFIMTADSGFRIKDVLVDSESKGPLGSYTFDEVREPRTIHVEFERSADDLLRPRPGPPPNRDSGLGGRDVSHLLNTGKHIQYIVGVGEGRFEPNRNIARAEAAQIFFNLLLTQDVAITRVFPDDTAGAWYDRAVNVLASLGILRGQPDGRFHPEDSITRAEFIAIAVRFARNFPDIPKEIPFDDVPAEHWASRQIGAAVQFGWITGYGDGYFHPNRHISRAEAVTIVNRMLNRVADREFIDSHPELHHFEDVQQTHWAFYDIMEAYITNDYERDDHGGEHWLE